MENFIGRGTSTLGHPWGAVNKNVNQHKSTFIQPEGEVSTQIEARLPETTMLQLASRQAKSTVKQLKLLAQIPFQSSKPVRIGTANLIPIHKAEYLVPK